MRYFWSLLLLAGLVQVSDAATYYLAKSAQGGNNSNSCSAAQSVSTPKLTFEGSTGALACLAPGDTLYVRVGAWPVLNSTTMPTLPSGSGWGAGQLITIRAYSGEVVTLKGVVLNTAKQYLSFEGFVLDGTVSGGTTTRECVYLSNGAGRIRVRDSEIKNCEAHGVLTPPDGTGFNEFLNNDIHHNGARIDLDHGMYIASSNNLVEGNVLHHNANYGIQFFSSGSSTDVSNNVFRKNIVHSNAQFAGSLKGGIATGSGTNNQIYNNLIYDNMFGIIVNFSGSNQKIYHNTIYNNAGDAIRVGPNSTNTEVRNNIVWGNGNSSNPINTTGAPSFTLSDNLNSNPNFVNVNANPRDLRLQASSTAAINQGTSSGSVASLVTTDFAGVARPQGGAYDIGAYEFVAEAPPPVTPDPPLALSLTYNCNASPSTANMTVLGSLFYLGAGAMFPGTDLVQASCASSSTMTDVASVVPPGFSTVRPFVFLGAGAANTGNTCTDCLSVHSGSPSVNEAASGWTLTDFRQGTSVAAATGGASPFTLMPGLCTRVVEGVTTTTPLWPWPMDARIQAARALAGRPAVSVTATVEGLLGTIPTACLEAVTPPPSQTTWFLATAGVDGGACSLAAPCATLAHVLPRMAGGHTLYLRSGTYSQTILTSTTPVPAGASWSAPTTLAAYQGETVTLQTNDGVVAHFNSPATDRYIVLDRLILDGQASTSTNSNGFAVTNGAGPIRFQNGTIRNSYFDRVFISTATGVEILTSTITQGTTLPAVRVLGATTGILLEGNTITDSPTLGISFGAGSHVNARVSRNIVHTNGTEGIALGSGTITAVNNLVHSNGTLGLRVLAGCASCEILYNTLADNGGTELQVDAGTFATVVTNNIAVGGIVDDETDSIYTTNLTTDPGFVGGGNYRIADPATSAAVDSGTCLPAVPVALDGTARPSSGCDIGAYEQAASPAAPGALNATPWGSSGFFIP